MANIWKAVIILAAFLLIGGLLLGGVGLLTGASPERVRGVMGAELSSLEAMFRQAQQSMQDMLASLRNGAV